MLKRVTLPVALVIFIVLSALTSVSLSNIPENASPLGLILRVIAVIATGSLFLFIIIDSIRLLNRGANKLLEKHRITWRVNFFIIIAMLIPLWLFVRAQIIYKEGPRIVHVIEEYKNKNHQYPQTLKRAGIQSLTDPMYYYDEATQEFRLTYSIFVFSRWCYDSEKKRWFSLD